MADEILTSEQALRKAALAAMDRFADANGVTDRDWLERDVGDTIQFIGTAPNGRKFGLGYQKDARREQLR